MSEGPEVAVVVATRNRAARLERLFRALESQTIGAEHFEVRVVDDCSEDETTALLEREAASGRIRLKHLRQASRRGPAAARNVGWRSTDARLIAFTDDDCEPQTSWLEAILAASQASTLVIQGRTVPNPAEIEQIGPYSRTLRVERLGPHYPTCNVAYPRSVLEHLRGFDESYPLPGGEDTDLALRALEDGASIVYEQGALVHHAVNQLGLPGKLRLALRWSPTMQVFARHPALRQELVGGVFWKSSHARLAVGILGSTIAGRRSSRWLAWGPYGLQVAQRMRAERARPSQAPFYPLYDAVEIFATVRGAVNYRVLVL